MPLLSDKIFSIKKKYKIRKFNYRLIALSQEHLPLHLKPPILNNKHSLMSNNLNNISKKPLKNMSISSDLSSIKFKTGNKESIDFKDN